MPIVSLIPLSNIKKISQYPSLASSLTYNGTEQAPTWNNYDSTQMTIGGTVKATNAGSYTATFTPNKGYCWADGSTSAYSINWSITKAAGSLSISKTSISLTYSTKSATFTVTRSGDGTITATSSNTSVATVSKNGTTITVTAKGSGTATITVQVGAGTNYTAPSNKTCSVVVNLVPNLENITWQEVSTICKQQTDATIQSWWKLGDTKTVYDSSNTAVGKAYIIDFNHNTVTSSSSYGKTYAAISWMYVPTSPITYDYSISYTQHNYSTDVWRTYAQNLWNSLSTALTNYTVATTVPYIVCSNGSVSISTLSANHFVPSAAELTGALSTTGTTEGSIYALFGAGTPLWSTNCATRSYGGTYHFQAGYGNHYYYITANSVTGLTTIQFPYNMGTRYTLGLYICFCT